VLLEHLRYARAGLCVYGGMAGMGITTRLLHLRRRANFCDVWWRASTARDCHCTTTWTTHLFILLPAGRRDTTTFVAFYTPRTDVIGALMHRLQLERCY